MKADKKDMFAVELSFIDPERENPFPLYLLLDLNNRFIPVSSAGDSLGADRARRILRNRTRQLWVPNNFREKFQKFFEKLPSDSTREGVPLESGATAQNQKIPMGDGAEVAAHHNSNPALSQVTELLESEKLTQKEKARLLSELSQDTLRALYQVSARGPESRSEGIRHCREIADQVLMVAAEDSNIYDEILALRSSQDDIDHSVMVGTFGVMFALALGFTDEKLLADIAVAAIFHDIGLTRLNPALFSKPESNWTRGERAEYCTHVAHSLSILRESGEDFHDRVYQMISDHHENYDGSGFPDGKKGAEIDDTSQLLHLANWFDQLCQGKVTEKELDPAAAFDFIYQKTMSGESSEVQPELVQRIFQFMWTEKAAADELAQLAEQVVVSAQSEKV